MDLKKELARFAYDFQNEISHADNYSQIVAIAEKYLKSKEKQKQEKTQRSEK